jgi:hypothetical protein
VAAAIANIEVRYAGDGVVVRTGWNRTGEGSAVQGGAPTLTPADWNVQAAALDRRLRDLEASARGRPPVQMASAPGVSDEDALRRMRELLTQSEMRQQRAFADRLTQISRDFDMQRKLDLAAIDQGMARLQSASGDEVRQYREMVQRVTRTAYQQK